MRRDMRHKSYGSYSLFSHGLTLSEREKLRLNKEKIVKQIVRG